MYKEYLNKVYKIAQVKYELNQDVMDSQLDQIKYCYNNGFTPIRTVEFIAERIF